MSKELKLAVLRMFIIISLLGLMIFMLTDCSSVIMINKGDGNSMKSSIESELRKPIDIDMFNRLNDTIKKDSL